MQKPFPKAIVRILCSCLLFSLTVLAPETAYAGNFAVTPPSNSILSGQTLATGAITVQGNLGSDLFVDNSAGQTGGWNVTVQTSDVLEQTPAGGYKSGTSALTISNSELLLGQNGMTVTRVTDGNPNLVPNPSFDTYTGSNGIANNWSSVNNGGTVFPTYSVVSSPVFSAFYSTSIKAQQISCTNINTTTDDDLQSSTFTVSPSTNMTVGVHYNVPAISNLQLALWVTEYNSSGSIVSNIQLANFIVDSPTSGYQSFLDNTWTTSSTAATARLTFKINYQGVATNNATIYLDDIYAGVRDTADPTILGFPSATPLNTPIKIISANTNTGLGVFDFALSSPFIQFIIHPYQQLDYENYAGGATPFAITLTWTLSSGP